MVYAAKPMLQIAALFSKKIKEGNKGRLETFSKLKAHLSKKDRTIWFHCASLGEFEQGLPVFKEVRTLYPDHKIVLTFFSPSGYNIRKSTHVANVVVYLPLDTKSNAKKFLDLVRPELTIFVKYDIWPNLLLELKHRKLKAILISALFRKHQSYFKFYGRYTRKALTAFEHIFVQDQASKNLIATLGFSNVSVAGDTRFDRVSHQRLQDNTLEFVSEFKNNKCCIVIGSSWPEDEKVLVPFINQYASKNVKYLFAPHNIKEKQIENLQNALELPSVRFSEREGKNLEAYPVLILDTIGLLSKAYAYADMAYVGGAMGHTGLHNILEPAVFGVPIIIGPHHKKFPEAKQMIANKGVYSIQSINELTEVLKKLIENKTLRKTTGHLNSQFIKKNKGAVIQILDYIRK